MDSIQKNLPDTVEFDRALIEKLAGSGPRYTSYPTADRFNQAFTSTDYQKKLEQRTIGALHKPLSVYIHVPFCNTICYYCGCNKIITKNKSLADVYLDYLEKELKMVTNIIGKKEPLMQLHFGGGTPTFFSDKQFTRIIGLLKEHFEFLAHGEYSIEIDPRKIGSDTVQHLGQLGFNRMSVGIQDFNHSVQEAVNRVQSVEETATVIDAARAAQFKSISVDLIYGLPLQSSKSVAQTLDTVLSLEPDRIALYNYAHLPTLFMPQRRINEADLPSASEKLDILQNSVQTLTDKGYIFIGMDHFAKPNDELSVALRQGRLHRNFQGYSTHSDCDLIGLGVSSIGQIGASYTQNEKELDHYYQAIDEGRLPVMRGLTLNKDDLLRRNIIQALMCQFSLCFSVYEELYQIQFQQYFSEEMVKLKELEQLGLLSMDKHSIVIKPKGRFLIRNIAMVFDQYLRTKPKQANYSKTI
ncbi:oxygen-independent coproporphyrinogen III oxidase [Neisseria sp. Ec49-e6-T10]|uniref:oxygen-independent coproporphyrinogen III oxidase n=1 Tax=Neisseria sp. Ec49-e6-T10 TaxID=3140744 RepID=UPI003EC05584